MDSNNFLLASQLRIQEHGRSGSRPLCSLEGKGEVRFHYRSDTRKVTSAHQRMYEISLTVPRS